MTLSQIYLLSQALPGIVFRMRSGKTLYYRLVKPGRKTTRKYFTCYSATGKKSVFPISQEAVIVSIPKNE